MQNWLLQVLCNRSPQHNGKQWRHSNQTWCLQDDSARQHALSNYSSNKSLKSGVTSNQDAAAKKNAADVEAGAHNGDNIVPDRILDNSLELGAMPHRNLAGDGTIPENNLDSSMGIGPVSHRSLAGSEGAAAAAAPVSHRSLGSAGKLPEALWCELACCRLRCQKLQARP